MTFTDSLTRAGVMYRIGHDPNEITLCCLFCQETRFRLGINTHTGAGHCFNCDWKSKRNAPYWVLRRLRIDPTGVSIRVPQSDTDTEVERPQLPADFTRLDRPVDSLDYRARRYLIRRGITSRQIHRHGIGASYSGRYAYRIVFPIHYDHGLKGIVARSFTGREPRYLNSRGDKWLWGFNPAKPTTILSEGVFKALRLERARPDRSYGSASLLGHVLSDIQLDQLIQSHCRRVILYPDPDQAGRRGVIAVADKLLAEWQREVYVVHPVQKPADIEDLAVMREQVEHALPYVWSVRQRLQLA